MLPSLLENLSNGASKFIQYVCIVNALEAYFSEASVDVVRFARPSYVGRIDNGMLQLETVLILGENTDNLNLTITGGKLASLEGI